MNYLKEMSKEIKKNERNIVLLKQANEITSSSNDLSSLEKRLMYMVQAQIRDTDPEDKIYRVSVKEFERLTNKKTGYTRLKEAANNLMKRVHTIFTETKVRRFAC